MSEEDKHPPTRADYYLDRHHKIINQLYEEAIDTIKEYQYNAAELLATPSIDHEVSRRKYVDSATHYASMAVGVEAFKESALRPIWKYGYIGMEYEAAIEYGNQIRMSDGDYEPPSDWVMLRFYIRRVIKNVTYLFLKDKIVCNKENGMKAIYKWRGPVIGEFILKLPTDFRVVHFAEQRGANCLWIMIDVESPRHDVGFKIYGTGDVIDDGYEYVSTCVTDNHMFVWHLFQKSEQ
jgi:hypothetical protein